MTTTEAFKRGFAEQLARNGLTPSMLMSKQAGWAAMMGGARAIGAMSPAIRTLLGLWLVSPVVAGGLTGYRMGRAEGPEQPDIDALKEEERVNIARRALRDLKRQQGLPV